MVIRARGEIVDLTDQVNLVVTFKDSSGTLINTDTYPSVSIVQPNGLVYLAPTTVGVSQVTTGTYSYVLQLKPILVWVFGMIFGLGTVSSVTIQAQLAFVVLNTQVPANPLSIDGYHALGDEIGFNYSQGAIVNINKLLKMLKARLNSSGKVKGKDAFGNTVFVDCDIFAIDMLVTFLGMALSDFNQVPFFTYFQFDDDGFCAQFGEILVEGATLYALSSAALIEKGREYTIQDNGLSFNPPSVADLLNTQYGTLLSHYWDKLKFIKNSLRPNPIGLGRYSISSSGMNPALRRLRFLKERRII